VVGITGSLFFKLFGWDCGVNSVRLTIRRFLNDN
jgi:hypothetical protein